MLGQRGGGAIDVVDTVKVEKESLRKATKVHSSSSSSADPLPLIGSIDQGTSSTRFILFSTLGTVIAWAQVEHTQIFPSKEGAVTGWHEHDPLEIWNNVVACMAAVVQAMDYELAASESPLPIGDRILPSAGYVIKAIGITNQRETTVSWNAKTGRTYYNAIVWDDTRTNSVANHLATTASSVSLMAMASGQTEEQLLQNDPKDRLRSKTGLPLASYFAGTKVKWLLDHVENLQRDMMIQPENVRFGTIDTWILYQLTGEPVDGSGGNDSSSRSEVFKRSSGNVGGLFLTDVSNASRWLFLDLEKAYWDPLLISAVCSPHQVPLSALPEIRPSSQVYAKLKALSTGIAKLDGVPVSAILGDQQAALFGQAAYEAGEAKNTYGTGMFLMMNTGTTSVHSHHGLLTTIAYQIADGPIVYALEGSVSHSGSTIQWLRDQMNMLENASESERIASNHNDGLYLVPAFAGLFAPHWRSDARGCIVGITAAHHKGHIVRAALEAAAYQAREVFDAIYADSKVLLRELKVDGGGSHNELLMQFQADMIRAPVVIPEVQETTAMGAAFAAGLAVGVWNSLDDVKRLWRKARVYNPKMSEEERGKNWYGWKKAVSRSLNWVEMDGDDDYFLDAETYIHSDDPVLVSEGRKAKERKTLAEMFEGISLGALLLLASVAGAGASLGFIFGRRRSP